MKYLKFIPALFLLGCSTFEGAYNIVKPILTNNHSISRPADQAAPEPLGLSRNVSARAVDGGLAHLDGVIKDQFGNPVEHATVRYIKIDKVDVGEAGTITKGASDSWCDNRPAPCSPAPPGYFSRPGGEEYGDYELEITTANGEVGKSELLHFDSNWKSQYITVPIKYNVDEPQIGDIAKCKLNLKNDLGKSFIYGFDYYGWNTTDDESRWDRDLNKFAQHNFCYARIFIDWNGYRTDKFDDRRTFDKDGNPVGVERLRKFIAVAKKHNIGVDVTFQASDYNFVKVDKEGYKITAHKKAIAWVVREFNNDPTILWIDAANEGKKRGGDSHCNGSPEWNHMSPGRMNEIYLATKSVDPNRKLTVSADGHPSQANNCGDSIISYYKSIESRGTRIVYTPHFPRVDSAPDNEGKFMAQLKSALRPDGIYFSQEPFRRGNVGDNNAGDWSVNDFIKMFTNSKNAGSAGAVLHGDYSYDLSSKDAWDQLDSVEMQVIDWISNQ